MIVSNPTIKKVKVKFPSSHETMTPFKMALICIAVCQVQRPLSYDPGFVQFIYHYRGHASKSSVYLNM